MLLSEHVGIKIGSVCNKEFVYAFDTDPDEKIISLFSNKIRCLPIINQNKKIVDIQFNNQIRHNLSSNKIYSRAPARITFGGGGSDSFDFFSQKNGLCINAAIKKYAFCSISPLEPNKGLRISSFGL